MTDLLTPAAEAVRAMADFAAAGFPVVGGAALAARNAACAACPALRRADWVCRECKCYLVVKARMATAECPLGKWEKPGLPLTGDPPPDAPRAGCCG